MRIFRWLILLIIIVIGVTFAVLNSKAVSINYYFATSQAALSLLMAICLAIGVILGITVMLYRNLKLKVRLGSTNRKLRKQEEALNAIHNITENGEPSPEEKA